MSHTPPRADAVLPAGQAGSLAPSRAVQTSILIFGVFACATSVIFLKKSDTHPFWLSGIRVLIAATALLPLYLHELRKARAASALPPVPLNGGGGNAFALAMWGALPGALLLAAHFITWTAGSRLTNAVNGSLLVNLAPVVMPFTMWMMNRERVSRGEIIGTGVSMLGVAMLVGANYQFAPENLHGDVLCFIAMVLFCFYIALGRRYGMAKNIWLYVVPLYAITGVLCIGTALVTGAPAPTFTGHEIAMLVCLGLIPTVVGHSSLNWCIKHMRGQIVSTVNLGQFIFAGVLAYAFLNREKPDLWFYPASILIVIGSVIVIRAHRAPRVATVDPES